MYKKVAIVALFIPFLLFVGNALATTSSEIVDYADQVTLIATSENNSVTLHWDIQGGTAPSGFKVIKSLNANPEYPPRDGDYWEYLSDANVRDFTWSDVPEGEWHFRVKVYQGTVYSNDVTVSIGNSVPVDTSDDVQLSLRGSANGNTVSLHWDVAGSATNGFKVIKSLNANPEYPPRDGDYWEYLSDANVRDFTWSDVPDGNWHFRVKAYQTDIYSNDIVLAVSGDGQTSSEDTILIPEFHAPKTYGAAWVSQTKPKDFDSSAPSFENQSFKAYRGDKIKVTVGVKNTGSLPLRKGELVIATYKDTRVHSAPISTGFDNPKNKNFGKSYFYDSATWLSSYQAGTIVQDILPGETGEIVITMQVPDSAPLGLYREDFSTAVDNQKVSKKWLFNSTNGDSWHVLHIWIGVNVVG